MFVPTQFGFDNEWVTSAVEPHSGGKFSFQILTAASHKSEPCQLSRQLPELIAYDRIMFYSITGPE